MHRTVALWAALAVFGAGFVYRISGWFRHGVGAGAREIPASTRIAAAVRGIAATVFSRRIVIVLRALVTDVLLQRKILHESAGRWLTHLAISTAFVLLVLLHALGSSVTARLFPGYGPRLNPFLFLRDLLAAVLLAGLIAAAYRRYAVRAPGRATSASDSYALVILAVILGSGILLAAARIGSQSSYRQMVAQYADPGASSDALRAYWVAEMGVVAPGVHPGREAVARGREIHAASCASCHARARSAFLAYASAAVLRPVAPALDAAGAPAMLSELHFLAVLLGLAYLPFSKLFHAFATPVTLLANAAAPPGRSAGPNHATRQVLELDACTHCSTCSTHCSTAMASVALRDRALLPSERMRALRALASGAPLRRAQLHALQEGIFLCTGCERCTVACPSGIDVRGLWLDARDTLLARGEPAYALLSPLSSLRTFGPEHLDVGAYRDGIDRARGAIAARFGAGGPPDVTAPLAPGGDQLWSDLRGSLQASTFSRCLGCKTCSTACPVVRVDADPEQRLGLLPHQVLHAARLRLWDLVLGSRILWDCLGCYQCQEHCPQGVQLTDLLYQLKNVAIAQATASATFEQGLASHGGTA